MRELQAQDDFLDLSNSTALYFFAGARVPVPVTASWNMIGSPEQRAAVDALEAEPPEVVFVATTDPASPPLWDPQLRPYLVQRWLWESGYRAYDVGGTTVLLSPSAAARAGSQLRALGASEADARLISSYPRLGAQYALWGRNWDSLRAGFQSPAQHYTDGRLEWQGSENPDFLRVDLSCDGDPGVSRVRWQSAEGEQVITLPLRTGVSLVPLAAYPSWFEREGNSLEMQTAAGCTVDEARVLRLRG